MKTYSNLFDQIIDFENLYYAYLKTSRHKRFRSYVIEFRNQYGTNLIDIQYDLENLLYCPESYETKTIYDPKERDICVSQFRDRIVQTALINIIEPLFDRSFYYHSYACRKDKGSHLASDTLNNWIYCMKANSNGSKVYCFKGDIHSFFKSINKNRLFEIILKKINDPFTLNLIHIFIYFSMYDDVVSVELTGVPIGNVSSQLFANIYLNELDNMIIHVLKPVHYERYMDDFVILSYDLDYLKYCMQVINLFVNDVLLLELNPKSDIFDVKNGIDFVGYRHFGEYKLLRKRSINHINEKICAFDKGIISDTDLFMSWKSFEGHASHADSFGIRSLIKEKVEERIDTENIILPKQLLYM